MKADPVKVGDNVRWLNAASAADEATTWRVESVTAAGTYARITDKPDHYKERQSFCVPVGRLVREDQYGTHSTWQPEAPEPDEQMAPRPQKTSAPRQHAGGMTKDDLPKGSPEFLYSWLQEQGANTAQLQQFKAVMDQPAPNGGVRAMRCKNWILNHFSREQ